ncbi:MAG TPA: hypothetical protein VJN71_07050 [Nitrososphaerales archaeon]|nr:hypothetical protein [Nitrososphaerales archaeon]
MPQDVLIETSITTNESCYGYLVGSVNIYPQPTLSNTSLYIGIYANGKLEANSTIDLSKSVAPIATMVGTPALENGNSFANFSKSVAAYFASSNVGANVIPSGSVITITAYSTSPIWVQTLRDTSQESYMTQVTASALPATLPAASLSTSLPLAVGGDCDAH